MGKITIELAKNKEEKEAIFSFRFNVIDSTGTYQPAIDFEQQKIEEPIDHKAWLFASRENSNITGTFRTYTLDKESFEFAKQCHLENWLRVVNPEQISCTSKFMIFNSKRKNRTILLLLKEHFKFLQKNNIKVDLICCPEPTMPYYEWVGYRKFAKSFHHSTSPWELVPMALITEDTSYLSKIRSPLVNDDASHDDNDSKLSIFLENTFPEEYANTSAYIQLRRLGNKYNLVFKNEIMKPFVEALQHQKFLNGETVYSKGEPGSSLYLIIAGSVKIGDKHYKSGDFFGEASLISPGSREKTALAQGQLETLKLESTDFYNILKDKPQTAPLILHLIGEKLRELNS